MRAVEASIRSWSRMRRGGALVLLVAVLLVAALSAMLSPAVAGGDASAVSLSASLSRTSLSSTGERSFALRVQMANTGPQTEVWLRFAGKPWPHAPGVSGGPLSFGIETLKGPGQLLPILISDPLPELFPWQCSRGPSFDYDWADVLVPAHSRTTLVVPMTANVPSWPGTDYTPEVFEDVVSGQSETETPIAVPRVTMGGPTGVHIEITAHTHGRLSTGAAVALTGSTSPPDPGAIVRVRVRAFVMQQNSWLGAAATVLFSRVRTDARGRFRIEGWHPRRPGVYEVLSRIDHPRHALQADKNCAPAIYVTTPR